MLCCNATGSSKIPPLLIGTTANPHCFRDGACPIPYVGQKNAWMDRVVFRHWWNNVFIPAIRSTTREPVALIMDGCSGHDGSIVDETGQITIFFLPPNTTSMFQPLDQGIIAAVKSEYRYRLLTKMVSSVENYEELQSIAQNIPRGRRGLDHGFPPHVIDAAKLIKESWDTITASTIAGCWARSSCLVRAEEELRSFREYKRQVDRKIINDIAKLLANLNFNEHGEHLKSTGLSDAVQCLDSDRDMLGHWIELENDEAFRQSEIDAILNDIDRLVANDKNSINNAASPTADTSIDESSSSSLFIGTAPSSKSIASPSVTFDNNTSDLSLTEATDMARKLVEFAIKRGNPVLADYTSIVYQQLCDVK